MKDLWIAGGSGAALEVLAVARALEASSAQEWKLRGFVTPNGRVDFDLEGLETAEEDAFLKRKDASRTLLVLAIGDPGIRSKAASRFAGAGFAFATLVHPAAVVGPRCEIGAGSVLMAQAVLETHVHVGAHTLLNVATSLAHNCILGDCCSLGPGVRLAGWVSLGDRCDLGVNACVRPRVTLGPGTRVGAGAAVVADHIGDTTLLGVPAKPLGL